MALIRSSLLSDIRGSIGGTTYSKVRGGLIARNRTVPYNPQSISQEQVRGNLGYVSGMFADLDFSQRQEWKAWADQLKVLNRLGEEYTPSVRQAFIMTRLNQITIGTTPTIAVPTTTTTPTFDAKKLSVASTADAGFLQTIDVTAASGGAAPAGQTYQIRLSPPMIAARGESYRNLMRGHNQFVSSLSTPLNALTAYENAFGGGGSVAAIPGQVVNVGFRLIETASGLASAWFYAVSEIATI